MEGRSTMTDEEMVKDYPRLKYEYTQLNQDYKSVKRKLTKQLSIAAVVVPKDTLKYMKS